MDFRTFYGVRGEARKGLTCHDQSRTRQEFLKESLTSTIMDRFAKTGILTPTVNTERIAQFGDFTEVPSDLLEASTRLDNVRQVFDELPASLRAQFGNSPLAFVNFMANPANKNKAIELGLVDSPVKAKPVKAKPVKTEPVKTEPVETEPVETEPVDTKPDDGQMTLPL